MLHNILLNDEPTLNTSYVVINENTHITSYILLMTIPIKLAIYLLKTKLIKPAINLLIAIPKILATYLLMTIHIILAINLLMTIPIIRLHPD